MEDKILIKLLLTKSEYETLITFIKQKYLVDGVSLLKEVINRGDINTEWKNALNVKEDLKL